MAADDSCLLIVFLLQWLLLASPKNALLMDRLCMCGEILPNQL
jgi:hypothetical protein